MHVDIDEANAAGLKNGAAVELVAAERVNHR
jgi:propanediol utilization protein